MVLEPSTLMSRKVKVTVSTARPSGVRDGASMLKSKSGWVGMAGPGRSLRPGCTAPGKVAALGCAKARPVIDKHAIMLAEPSAQHQTRDSTGRLLEYLAEFTQIPSPGPRPAWLPYAYECGPVLRSSRKFNHTTRHIPQRRKASPPGLLHFPQIVSTHGIT